MAAMLPALTMHEGQLARSRPSPRPVATTGTPTETVPVHARPDAEVSDDEKVDPTGFWWWPLWGPFPYVYGPWWLWRR